MIKVWKVLIHLFWSKYHLCNSNWFVKIQTVILKRNILRLLIYKMIIHIGMIPSSKSSYIHCFYMVVGFDKKILSGPISCWVVMNDKRVEYVVNFLESSYNSCMSYINSHTCFKIKDFFCFWLNLLLAGVWITICDYLLIHGW